MAIVYLSLGSNLGDRVGYLQQATSLLSAVSDIKIVATSSFYESEPWQMNSENWFVNAIVQISTSLTPDELLKECQRIEAQLGRKRDLNSKNYIDRTIDIDILFYDDKIILEKEIKGREIEIALLGNDNVITSYPGEVDIKDEFYNYNSKYQNPATKTMVPLNMLGTNLEDELREIAIKVFKAIGAKDLARVDFFVEERTNVVYVNEINTMPDITEDSMYIKLFDAIGIEYTEVLDKLIKYAMKK